MPPRPRKMRRPLCKDPFAASWWTPGSLGLDDCADPNLPHVFRAQERTAAPIPRKMPKAPASDVAVSVIGDALLNDEHMDPDAVKKFKAILSDLRAQGLPVRVHEAYRTPERQKNIYASGRTDDQLRKAGYTEAEIKRARRAGFPASAGIAAPSWKSGNKGHGGGLAMDVWWVVKGKGQPAAPHASWKKALAVAVAAQGCAWGGNWKWKKDPPHVEYFKK